MSNFVINITPSKKSEYRKKQKYLIDNTYIDLSTRNNSTIYNNTNGEVDVIYDYEAVKDSLLKIFTWRKGERILYPDFGEELSKYLYGPILNPDDTGGTAGVYAHLTDVVKKAILEYEPRVSIEEVINTTTENDMNENVFKFAVRYRIINLTITSIVNASKDKYSEIQELEITIDKERN